jgi:hypothetical protein
MIKNRIEKLIDQKRLQEDDKSQRDVTFLRSLSASYDHWGALTDKQRVAFERMEHLNSHAGLEEAQQWVEEYKKRHATTAKLVALYYLSTSHFFRDTCLKIASNQNYIPTKRQYSALCENKFAKKVIRELKRKPAFATGELVKMREGNSVPLQLCPLRGRICVVIENSLDSIKSYAKGSKEYKLLPFGSANTIVCQERHIKAMRKRAK